MIMDANMNVLWRNPDRVPTAQIERMNAFWETNRGARLDTRSIPACLVPLKKKRQTLKSRLRTKNGSRKLLASNLCLIRFQCEIAKGL